MIAPHQCQAYCPCLAPTVARKDINTRIRRSPFWLTVSPPARRPLARRIVGRVMLIRWHVRNNPAVHEALGFVATLVAVGACIAALPFISDIAKVVR